MTENAGINDRESQYRQQNAEQLRHLLSGVLDESRQLQQRHARRVPILVKVSPDMEPDELRSSAEAVAALPIDGIVATNSTLSRDGIDEDPHNHESGGLSGRPLLGKSGEAIRIVRECVGSAMPIIGAGGIMTGADARMLREAGADLVQLYTGMVYRGPRLIKEVAAALDDDGKVHEATRL